MCTSTCTLITDPEAGCRSGFVEEGEGEGEGEAEAERARRVGSLPVVYMLICRLVQQHVYVPVCFHVENLCTRLRDL